MTCSLALLTQPRSSTEASCSVHTILTASTQHTSLSRVAIQIFTATGTQMIFMTNDHVRHARNEHVPRVHCSERSSQSYMLHLCRTATVQILPARKTRSMLQVSLVAPCNWCNTTAARSPHVLQATGCHHWHRLEAGCCMAAIHGTC